MTAVVPPALPTGEKYVWEIEDVFGPVFLTVDHCVGGMKPRVFFHAQMPGGKIKRITRNLPLTPFITRRDWSPDELQHE